MESNLGSTATLLFLPPIAAMVSAVFLVTKVLTHPCISRTYTRISAERKLSIHYSDGLEILSFKVLRSLGILGLLLLQLTQLMARTDIEWISTGAYELIVYVCASFSSILRSQY